MNLRKRRAPFLALVLATLALTGCGGGGGDNPSSAKPEPGTSSDVSSHSDVPIHSDVSSHSDVPTHQFAKTWSTDENYHWHACTIAGHSDTKDKAAHAWNAGVVTTPADYGKDGEKTFTCTVCGKTKVETLPALQAQTNSIYLNKDVVTTKEYDRQAFAFTRDQFTFEGDGAFSVGYKKKGAEDATYIEEAPIVPGTYTVKASVEATKAYLAASLTFDCTIRPKSISGPIDLKLPYNGGFEYELSDATLQTMGLFEDDDVLVTLLFEDKAVGSTLDMWEEEITVRLKGKDVSKYYFNPSSFTAEIVNNILRLPKNLNFKRNASVANWDGVYRFTSADGVSEGQEVWANNHVTNVYAPGKYSFPVSQLTIDETGYELDPQDETRIVNLEVVDDEKPYAVAQTIMTITGRGVIAICAIPAGTIHKGDTLIHSGTGKAVTVKSIEMGRTTIDSANRGTKQPGLLLEGITRDEILRGDLFYEDGTKSTYQRFEAEFTLGKDAGVPYLGSGSFIEIGLHDYREEKDDGTFSTSKAGSYKAKIVDIKNEGNSYLLKGETGTIVVETDLKTALWNGMSARIRFSNKIIGECTVNKLHSHTESFANYGLCQSCHYDKSISMEEDASNPGTFGVTIAYAETRYDYYFIVTLPRPEPGSAHENEDYVFSFVEKEFAFLGAYNPENGAVVSSADGYYKGDGSTIVFHLRALKGTENAYVSITDNFA